MASHRDPQTSFKERQAPVIHRANTVNLRGRFGWKKTWTTPIAITGFYLLALLCAVAHCCFFVYLDGRIISQDHISSKTTTISQGYVTTTSLLVVTAFRAALLASIATCYTQMLWATFRQLMLKISLIEDLIQVQTNAFRFANHQLYLKTPVLAAVAAFGWLIPIATIYPPGALVVGLQDSRIATSFNVSVFHQKNIWDTQNPESIASIWCMDEDDEVSRLLSSFPEAAQNASLLQGCELTTGFTPNRLTYITGSSLVTGQIARLHHPSGENSSYTLNFWGTILSCETKNSTIETLIDVGNRTVHSESHEILTEQLRSNDDPRYLSQNTITYRVGRKEFYYDYYPCLNGGTQTTANVSIPNSTIHVIVPITETVCYPKIVRYNVSISHAHGTQFVYYSIREDSSIPSYTWSYKSFNGSFEQFVQFSDAVAIYSNFAANLNRSDTVVNSITLDDPSGPKVLTPYTLDNGSVVQACQLKVTREKRNTLGPRSDLWPLSVFEQQLDRPSYFDSPYFDSTIANDLLINTTISTLSMNERFDIVQGTESRTFNIYHFQNKLAFFLPYGLSLGLAIPILVLGLIALHVHNHGVSAITGGFVQILMTTTGRTAIESAVLKSFATLGGQENLTKELQDLEIRFGELVDDDGDVCRQSETAEPLLNRGSDGAGSQSGTQEDIESAVVGDKMHPVQRAGFGTVEDIRPLRKRGKTSIR